MGQVQPDVRQLHFVPGLPAPQLFWASEGANSLLPRFPSGAPSLRVGERSAASMAQSPSPGVLSVQLLCETRAVCKWLP